MAIDVTQVSVGTLTTSNSEAPANVTQSSVGALISSNDTAPANVTQTSAGALISDSAAQMLVTQTCIAVYVPIENLVTVQIRGYAGCFGASLS